MQGVYTSPSFTPYRSSVRLIRESCELRLQTVSQVAPALFIMAPRGWQATTVPRLRASTAPLPTAVHSPGKVIFSCVNPNLSLLATLPWLPLAPGRDSNASPRSIRPTGPIWWSSPPAAPPPASSPPPRLVLLPGEFCVWFCTAGSLSTIRPNVTSKVALPGHPR